MRKQRTKKEENRWISIQQESKHHHLGKKNKRKGAGRPAPGTPEAKGQTAAACQANRRRRARHSAFEGTAILGCNKFRKVFKGECLNMPIWQGIVECVSASIYKRMSVKQKGLL